MSTRMSSDPIIIPDRRDVRAISFLTFGFDDAKPESQNLRSPQLSPKLPAGKWNRSISWKGLGRFAYASGVFPQ